MKKRWISLFLSFLMLTSLPMINTFAQTDQTEETGDKTADSTIEVVQPCEFCGKVDVHAETCPLYAAALLSEGEQEQACTECGGIGSHTAECSLGAIEPQQACTECGGIGSHTAECSLGVNEPQQACTECGGIGNHTAECSLNPDNKTEEFDFSSSIGKIAVFNPADAVDAFDMKRQEPTALYDNDGGSKSDFSSDISFKVTGYKVVEGNSFGIDMAALWYQVDVFNGEAPSYFTDGCWILQNYLNAESAYAEDILTLSAATEDETKQEMTDPDTGVTVQGKIDRAAELSVSEKPVNETGLNTDVFPVGDAALFYAVTMTREGADYQPEGGATVRFPETAVQNGGLSAGDSYHIYQIQDDKTVMQGPFVYDGGSISAVVDALGIVGIAKAGDPADLAGQHGGTYTKESVDALDLTVTADPVTLYDGFGDSVYSVTVPGMAGTAVEAIAKITFADGFVLYQFAYYGEDADLGTVCTTYAFIAADTTVSKDLDGEGIVSAMVGQYNLRVTGTFPDQTSLYVQVLTEEMSDYIHSTLLELEVPAEEEMHLAYDISLKAEENRVQPDGIATVKLSGLDTDKYTVFSVFHLPNTDMETVQRVMNGEEIILDAPEKLTPVTVEDGSISFKTDGFSVYYIVAGTSDNGNNWIDTSVVELPTESSTYYVEPGTIITFASGTFSGNDTDGITRSNRTITVAMDAAIGTRAVFSVSNWGSRITLTFIVSDRNAVINGAIANHPVYLSILTSGETGIPSEPGITTGDYTRYDSNYSSGWSSVFAETAEGIISESITDQLIASVDGSSTVGVYDATGNAVLRYLSGIDWDTMLDKAVVARANATDGNRITDDNKSNYVVIPYVVKLMAESGTGWHIDCVVVPASRITLSYDLNLKNYVIIGATLTLPNAVTSSSGEIKSTVGSIQGVTPGQTLKATLNGEEYNVKFLGWSRDPNAVVADPSLDPGDSITVHEDTVLYAVWEGKQTSGELRLQKTEVFEEADDERRDDGTSYTFTVNFANAEAGKTYPYTVYHADNTVKIEGQELASGGTVSLRDGEYMIVDRVPGGEITISEQTSESSQFDVSWDVGGSKTEGDYVTAMVTAGAQTKVVCVNTYAPLNTDLTIQKTDCNSKDENQSFIFDVVGPNGIRLTVTVNGNGSVTICDLPLGEYTVTEQTEWSWRYTPADRSQSIELDSNPDENVVAFKNSRTVWQWLSGDSFAENQFNIN